MVKYQIGNEQTNEQAITLSLHYDSSGNVDVIAKLPEGRWVYVATFETTGVLRLVGSIRDDFGFKTDRLGRIKTNLRCR